MKRMVLLALLLAPPAWAEGAVKPNTKRAAAAASKTDKTEKPTAATPAQADAPKTTATKDGRSKAVDLEATDVTGERQRPKVNYVLRPNVKAVRDAANSITNDHLEAARKPAP
jgi:hypothetical protein